VVVVWSTERLLAGMVGLAALLRLAPFAIAGIFSMVAAGARGIISLGAPQLLGSVASEAKPFSERISFSTKAPRSGGRLVKPPPVSLAIS